MLNRLNPEMILGFLLATVFWAAVLGWQASYSPTEREKQECAETAKKSGHKTEDCKTFWEKTTNDPIALSTFGTFIFTGVLGISTIFLWGATKTAANAAKTAAEHVPRVERAYIFGGPSNIVMNLPGRKTTFDIQIGNSGRTPALLKEICLVISTTCPTGEPNYPNPQIVVTDLAIDGAATGVRLPINSSTNLVSPYFAYGFFKYDDIFHVTHTSRFCARIIPAMGKFEIAGGPAWNDWD